MGPLAGQSFDGVLIPFHEQFDAYGYRAPELQTASTVLKPSPLHLFCDFMERSQQIAEITNTFLSLRGEIQH
eukprot:759550-Hanusia_phi.AAC.4